MPFDKFLVISKSKSTMVSTQRTFFDLATCTDASLHRCWELVRKFRSLAIQDFMSKDQHWRQALSSMKLESYRCTPMEYCF